jgi:hypothetical protein
MGIYSKIAVVVLAVVAAIFIFLAGMLVERAWHGKLDPGSFGRLAEAPDDHTTSSRQTGTRT